MIEDLLKLFDNILKKRYKVAIVSFSYPFQRPSVSGVGTHVYNLVTQLAKKRCEIHVFTSSEKDSIKKIRLGQGKIIIHFLKINFKFKIDNPIIKDRAKIALFENKVLNEFILEHLRRPFNIIHTHGWVTSSSFMVKHLYNVPWIHTLHAVECNRLDNMTNEEKKISKIINWLEETIIDANKIICVSKKIQKEANKHYPEITTKTIVIPNGVDLRLFCPGKNDQKSILTISRFSKEKGSHLLPEIIEEVLSKDKNSKYTVIMHDTNILELIEVKNKLLELQKRFDKRFIWIKEPIYATELIKYYQNSGIYVQPSIYEAFGLCILESMACGNAVIATNIGGIPEFIGDSAILVKPNPDCISKALIKLLKNPALINKYKKLSLERAKKYDWPAIADQVLDVYKEQSTTN